MNKVSLVYTKLQANFISYSPIFETMHDFYILTTQQSMFFPFWCHHIHTNVIQSLHVPYPGIFEVLLIFTSSASLFLLLFQSHRAKFCPIVSSN